MNEATTDILLVFYMQVMASISGAGMGTAIWLLIRHIDSPLYFIMQRVKDRYGKESHFYTVPMESPFVICGVVGLLISLFPFMGLKFALFSISGAMVIGYVIIKIIKRLP